MRIYKIARLFVQNYCLIRPISNSCLSFPRLFRVYVYFGCLFL